jgi:hypothetical protein
MRNLLLLTVFALLYSFVSYSQQYYYSDNYTDQGFEVLQSTPEKIRMESSVNSWNLSDISINREIVQKIELPGHFLPNDEGMPDLPGSGRYIAIPQGAAASLRIVRMQTETLQNIELAPAPRIPKTTENGPLFYAKNQSVYNTNAFFPANPVKLSEPTQIRGVDVVMLGITPFQYNPVSKELIVIRDIEIEVVFEGGNGQFGNERLLSRWWKPLLEDMLVNYDQLPSPSPVWGRAGEGVAGARDGEEAEYLIICPDDPVFLAWADTIKLFRSKQGISTGILTTTEIGGNTVSAIRTYINNAYNTWDIPPAAILILGDYGTSGSTVVAPIWDNYCASDNIFGDVNNDDLPDIVMSRIMAQNTTHLETMISKFIGYETNPPVDPEYYNHPITALGWQTERWFQVCIEVVGGFFRNELGKDPVRVNAIYDGNPSVDPWSTAPNTGTIMNYFGPNGLDYIPASPSVLGGWSGGSSNQINSAINSGSFLLLHRDHGFEQGWGEPAYSNSSLSGLDNDDLTFVYSVNCLTGKFNYGGECFAEAFYRQPKRALGIIAASEVSYSFVNDTYVWGAFDNMWPDFMPAYGTNPESRGHLPAFSNAAGKFFLQQSSWPYNTGNKEMTYHLFHHFGDAFSSIYSEVPQELLVIHNDVMMGGSSTFTVQADQGSLIALSVNGEIIGVAEGTSEPVNVEIIAQIPGTAVDLVVTKTNYFRYEASLMVISPNSPYVIYQDHLLNDETENGDGLMDYAESILLNLTIQNIGNVDAENVNVTLSSSDPYILITDSTELAGSIPGNTSLALNGAFACTVADTIPDNRIVFFTVKSDDGDSVWFSDFTITAHAPVLEFSSFTIDDSEENDNGRIDPGETVKIDVEIKNSGSSNAFNVEAGLTSPDGYITILSGQQNGGDLGDGENTTLSFYVSADDYTPGGYNASFTVDITSSYNRHGQGNFNSIIGQFSALVLDLDPNNNSAPAVMQSFGDMDLIASYATALPSDLSIYKSVFVSLGIYYSSHELTEAEALILKNYLDDGGKLYMEGRLTWHTDQQTSLHPMFNISTEAVNWYEYDSIYSVSGTFTDGMTFAYDMTQPYNNHFLLAAPPAYELFKALPGSNALMVAYDAGDYKTIGANMEFGGLVDGEYPSTKKELMSQILEFFGDILTGSEEPISSEKNLTIQTYPNPFTGSVNFSFRLHEPSSVKLEVFDMTGRLVQCIFDGFLVAGAHRMTWNLPETFNGSSEGLYFYRFNSGTEIQGGKLILIE